MQTFERFEALVWFLKFFRPYRVVLCINIQYFFMLIKPNTVPKNIEHLYISLRVTYDLLTFSRS